VHVNSTQELGKMAGIFGISIMFLLHLQQSAEPNGSLRKKAPSKTIELANKINAISCDSEKLH